MPPNDDQPFSHYKLKHRLIAWISTHLFDHMTYTVRHGLLTGMKRKGGLGWVPNVFSKQTETAERAFWRRLDLRGKTVYDVGAFQGLLTLFFARQAGQVISYEPNTHNHARLMENIFLNGLSNIRVRKTGIGSSPQTLQMVVNPLMPGGASVEERTTEQLLRSEANIQTEQIPITTLDLEIAAGMPVPDFIKIDIEGWEIEALKGARHILLTCKPAIFLEMHGETMKEKRRKVAEIVAFLTEIGYQSIRHIESGTLITPQNSVVAVEGHLYCLPQG